MRRMSCWCGSHHGSHHGSHRASPIAHPTSRIPSLPFPSLRFPSLPFPSFPSLRFPSHGPTCSTPHPHTSTHRRPIPHGTSRIPSPPLSPPSPSPPMLNTTHTHTSIHPHTSIYPLTSFLPLTSIHPHTSIHPPSSIHPQTGEACVNNQRIRAEWDYSRQRDAPSLVLDRHGLRCANPDDESTCPKARRCVVGGGCHTDQPDWSDPAVLADPNIGWGERAVPFLDPTVRRDWKYVGDDYPWTSVDWGIAPTSRATG